MVIVALVNQDGWVENAAWDTMSFDDIELAQCAIALVKGMTFQRLRRGKLASVHMPLGFHKERPPEPEAERAPAKPRVCNLPWPEKCAWEKL